MQILYQMDITNDYSLENLDIFLENFGNIEIEDNGEEKIKENQEDMELFQTDEIEYIKENIPTLIESLEKIDTLINDHLEGWTINRLSKVDKEILRVAVYEFLFRKDIPMEVSINEAVEIAKNFGGNNSSKFVNGILGSIYRTLQLEKWREHSDSILRTMLSVLV